MVAGLPSTASSTTKYLFVNGKTTSRVYVDRIKKLAKDISQAVRRCTVNVKYNNRLRTCFLNVDGVSRVIIYNEAFLYIRNKFIKLATKVLLKSLSKKVNPLAYFNKKLLLNEDLYHHFFQLEQSTKFNLLLDRQILDWSDIVKINLEDAVRFQQHQTQHLNVFTPEAKTFVKGKTDLFKVETEEEEEWSNRERYPTLFKSKRATLDQFNQPPQEYPPYIVRFIESSNKLLEYPDDDEGVDTILTVKSKN
jgi:hypothetical protein